MKTELKSKCCGAEITEMVIGHPAYGYVCHKCSKRCESQEPQSETPINKLVLHGKLVDISTGKDIATGWYWVSDTDYKTLERELGEAKRDANNCRQIIDTYSRQGDDLLKFQQELAQVRGELEHEKTASYYEAYALVVGERDLLAKEKHKMREALENCERLLRFLPRPHRSSAIKLEDWDKAIQDSQTTLSQPDLSSLTVLTRAEVEKLPCGCKWKETNNCFGDKELIGDKCPRCLLLERFTK